MIYPKKPLPFSAEHPLKINVDTNREAIELDLSATSTSKRPSQNGLGLNSLIESLHGQIIDASNGQKFGSLIDSENPVTFAFKPITISSVENAYSDSFRWVQLKEMPARFSAAAMESVRSVAMMTESFGVGPTTAQ